MHVTTTPPRQAGYGPQIPTALLPFATLAPHRWDRKRSRLTWPAVWRFRFCQRCLSVVAPRQRRVRLSRQLVCRGCAKGA